MFVKLTPGVDFIIILRSIFCQYFCTKKSQSQNINRENLCKALSYKKRERKMLLKLTSVIPDRGAVKRCRIADKYCIYWLFIKVLPPRVPQIAIFSQVRVPPIFLNSKGCRKPKKVQKQCCRQTD